MAFVSRRTDTEKLIVPEDRCIIAAQDAGPDGV